MVECDDKAGDERHEMPLVPPKPLQLPHDSVPANLLEATLDACAWCAWWMRCAAAMSGRPYASKTGCSTSASGGGTRDARQRGRGGADAQGGVGHER